VKILRQLAIYLLRCITLQKLLYWTGPLKSLADELCAEGRRYVTLKNYLPGTEAATRRCTTLTY